MVSSDHVAGRSEPLLTQPDGINGSLLRLV
jgi:hypothetical protein